MDKLEDVSLWVPPIRDLNTVGKVTKVLLHTGSIAGMNPEYPRVR
jgi:hypothetical protein